MSIVANAFVRFSAEDAGVLKQMNLIEGGFASLQKSVLKFASVTAASAAFIGLIRGAMDFETALVGVQKTTGATEEALGRLGKMFKEVGLQTGISKVEIAAIGEAAGKLGVFAKSGEAGMAKFVTTIAKSRVTMKDYADSSEDAALKTGRLLNVFGLQTKDAERFLSTINVLSDQTASSSAEIAEFASRLAAVGKTLGAPTQSILGLGAAIGNLPIDSSKAAMAVSQTLIVMQGNVDKISGYLGKYGSDFKKAFAEDPIAAFQIFEKELGKMDKVSQINVLKNLGLSGRNFRDTLLLLSGEEGVAGLAKSLTAANEEFKTGASSQSEFQRAMSTTAEKLKALVTTITNIGGAIASKFLPFIGMAADFIRENIIAATALTGALGSLLAAYIALQATASLVGIFKSLGVVMGIVSGAWAGNISGVAALISGAGKLGGLMTWLNNIVVAVSFAFGQGGLWGVVTLLAGAFAEFVLPVAAAAAVIYALTRAYKESADVQKAVHTVTSALARLWQTIAPILGGILSVMSKLIAMGLNVMIDKIILLAKWFNAYVEWSLKVWRTTEALWKSFTKIPGAVYAIKAALLNVIPGMRQFLMFAGLINKFLKTEEGGNTIPFGPEENPNPEVGGGGGGGGGGVGSDKGKAEAKQKLEEEEKKLLELQKTQFNLRKTQLEVEQKILERKKEEGTITEKESARLERINRFVKDLPKELFDANEREQALVDSINDSETAWKDANKAVDDQVKKIQNLRNEIRKIDEDIANIREEFEKEWGSMTETAVGGEQMADMAKEAATQYIKINEQIEELQGKGSDITPEESVELNKLIKEREAANQVLQQGVSVNQTAVDQLEKQLFLVEAQRKGKEMEHRAGRRDQEGINDLLSQEEELRKQITAAKAPSGTNAFADQFRQQVDTQEGAKGMTFIEQLRMKFEDEKAERLRQANERIADEELQKTHLMNKLTKERNHLKDLQTARDLAHQEYVKTLTTNQAAIEVLVKDHATLLIAQYNAIEQAARRAYRAVRGNFPVDNGEGGDGGGEGNFASGGYTGSGNPRDFAGFVHRREWVANASTTQRYPGLIRFLDSLQRKKGYSQGGFVGSAPNGGDVTNNNTVQITIPTIEKNALNLRAAMEEAGFMLTRRLAT